MRRFKAPLALCTTACVLVAAACSEDHETIARRDAGILVRRDASAATQGADAATDQTLPDVRAGLDSGAQAALDATAAIDDEVRCTGLPPVMKVHDTENGIDLDPDWTCYDVADAGVIAADAGVIASDAGARSATFTAEGLLPGLLGGVTADFYFGSSTLGKPAVTRVFGADGGSVRFDVPPGSTVLSARLHALARADTVRSLAELRQYDFLIPPVGVPIQSYLVLNGSRDLIVNLALGGEREDPTKAILMSAARDCRGHDVSGGQFELIDGETNLPVATSTAPGAPRGSYFKNALPTTTCTFTSNDQAVWVLINAPVNVSAETKTHSYRLRLRGRRRESDVAPVVFGEVEVETVSNVVSLVRTYRQTSP